jgi:hypothetical protein
MQKGFLKGTKTQTRGGTIWSPNEISDAGIEFYESTIDSLFRGIDVLDTGFSGKKYRFEKWIQKHWMAIIIGIIIPVIGIIITVAKP